MLDECRYRAEGFTGYKRLGVLIFGVGPNRVLVARLP